MPQPAHAQRSTSIVITPVRQLSKDKIIAQPIGKPIEVRGSCRTTALTESPTRFTARIPIASHRPHCFCRASPTTAQTHAVPTPNMSRTESAVPIFWNPRWASGFNRHTMSSVPSGVSSAATVTAHAVAPKGKKDDQHLHPRRPPLRYGGFYNVANQKYRGFHGTHCPTRPRMSRVPVFCTHADRPNHQVRAVRFPLFFSPFSLHLAGCGKQHS